jgi:DNA polymerase I
MGFMNSLLDVIKREKPDHLAVCFDKGGSVERVELYQAYKANRDATPEAIKIAVPYIEEILRAMHIPIMVKEGFEADDVIGTLSKQAEKEGYKTYMVTPDKDFAQLVSENIFMYKPRFGGGYDIWGVEEVKQNFEVENPLQVIDFLGMMGDASDNIPGLPGVGEKTAKKFIADFGSMENLLANTHQLKGKMKEKIEEAKELGILSKKLATIMLDVPVQFNANDFTLDQPDLEKVTEIFNDLEFRNLLVNFTNTFAQNSPQNNLEDIAEKPTITEKKSPVNTSNQFDLFASPGSGNVSEIDMASGFKTIENTSHFYQHINSPFSRKILIDKLMQHKSV